MGGDGGRDGGRGGVCVDWIFRIFGAVFRQRRSRRCRRTAVAFDPKDTRGNGNGTAADTHSSQLAVSGESLTDCQCDGPLVPERILRREVPQLERSAADDAEAGG